MSHTVQLASVPNIVGEMQWGIISPEEGLVLVIKMESPVALRADERIPILKW